MDADLAWRVEAACREAWPCPDETIRDGWVIRASGGPTRRTNSVNPLPGNRADITTMLTPARARYAALGQDLIVRVPAIVSGLDAALDRLGFAAGEGETITHHLMLAGRTGAEAALCDHPTEQWIAARARLSGWAPEAMAIYRRMLGLIAGPVAFASVAIDGSIAGVAYGAIVDGLVVIESVVVDPARRGQGIGRRIVGALLDWAHARGVAEACLQVEAANAPARALYRRLGFGHELYRYRYRRLP